MEYGYGKYTEDQEVGRFTFYDLSVRVTYNFYSDKSVCTYVIYIQKFDTSDILQRMIDNFILFHSTSSDVPLYAAITVQYVRNEIVS